MEDLLLKSIDTNCKLIEHLMTLAIGIIAFSVTFNKEIIKNVKYKAVIWIMVVSWIAYLLSVLFGLMNYGNIAYTIKKINTICVAGSVCLEEGNTIDAYNFSLISGTTVERKKCKVVWENRTICLNDYFDKTAINQSIISGNLIKTEHPLYSNDIPDYFKNQWRYFLLGTVLMVFFGLISMLFQKENTPESGDRDPPTPAPEGELKPQKGKKGDSN